MFDKILIANRGEIACRVMRTCERLGIRTVAVFSDADRDALHVLRADERVHIGPAPARESYLAIERIVEACRASGAQAVHPGYGFLSENPRLPQALEAAGIAFIGPPVAAIEAMGDKITSKRLAQKAGVSTVPGHPEPVTEPAEALRIARDIGFPVMVKAAAGGGGKGMRIAHREQELLDGLERARSEAGASFGDERVFLEKFIERPRHIEIQVLGDRHGTIIHLGERECSIQRRHQKVLEEAPSPFLDEHTRASMGAQAVELAAAVGYHSAGTVEFIVDQDKNFYFLEMNTRLQVEHPVTELVTGLDLVELMIRVAAGERLPLQQSQVSLRGWAIEARVYAEDPTRGFLPSTGRLVRYGEPEGPGIRVDSGVFAGAEVSMFYDPMIAKLCAYGENRAEAAASLRDALDAFVIRGPTHNIGFLNAVLAHPRFAAGDLSTDFIAREYGDRFEQPPIDPALLREFAAIATAMRVREAVRAASTTGKLPGWRYRPVRAWTVQLADEVLEVDVSFTADGQPTGFEVAGQSASPSLDWRPGEIAVRARVGGRAITLQADPMREGYVFRHGGVELPVWIRTRDAAIFAARMPRKSAPDTGKTLTAPMPGLIVKVAVREGEEIKAGQEVCVLEAMKMENVLRAERDALVAELHVRERDVVAADQALITFA